MMVSRSLSERCSASRVSYEKNEYFLISCPSMVPRMKSGWKSNP